MISMAKSMTVGKRENEKKRLAKREEKLKKKESKKLSGKANSFEKAEVLMMLSHQPKM